MKEKRQLARLVKKYNARGVISDNRLGFYSKTVPSIYITHQLKMALPGPASLANYIHHSFIKKFSMCWIPDLPANELAGSFSEDEGMKSERRYIGPLSRFSGCEVSTEKEYGILVILSGPEPQRSFLEEKVIRQLNTMKGKFMLVRGVDEELPGEFSFQWKKLVGGKELKELICSAEMVVSRSGYSSLMDYYFLGNKALLIPTPGQAEQEYLAEHLAEQGIFYTVTQEGLDLEKDVVTAAKYKGFSEKNDFQPDWKELFGLF